MHILVIFFLFFLEEQKASVIRHDLVCTDFISYRNANNNTKCFYNPDLDSTPEILNDRYGFDLKKHTVTTEDGYILTIFQLSLQHDNKNQKSPVILQHGVLVDGRSWFISGQNSLAFVIARNGFDLWIPNFRGTKYSKMHLNSSISQEEYWNFSFHEMGLYDLPAIIEYISNSTNRKDILYIGHSMGCSAFMVYSSLKMDHAQNHIKGALYLAPVVYFDNPPPVLRVILPFTNLIKNTLNLLHIYAIGPESKNLLKGFNCSSYPSVVACQFGLAIVSGFVAEQVRPELLPLIMKYFPTGLSLKTLVHFAQIIINHGRFQQYDYGKIENMEKYKSELPPNYEIEKIKTPIYIFAGAQDLLSEIRDVNKLYRHIRAPKKIRIYDLSHVDYIYGKNVTKVYKDILDTLNFFVNDDHKI
ncbi:lipase 3-like isoform X1 [Diorhabda carinulata]|uniref:lipase 3-like isoform X1 n=1 Tax=Diorhabda carinulata TaxID=1163345 RepID=UPI0025A297ED|nr:lipase 3-like isoform X1 [Diorhabda carinulata]